MADLLAGWLAGAVSILIGSPLDILKVRLQAGKDHRILEEGHIQSQFSSLSELVKGSAAPVIGYGALNAILYAAYDQTLLLLQQDPSCPDNLAFVLLAGIIGGIATWIISCPVEVIKCRTQISAEGVSSRQVAKDTFMQQGLPGLYHGGLITVLRDCTGFGSWFWAYELLRRIADNYTQFGRDHAWVILLAGGVSGVISWVWIYPLDVVKTRQQTFELQSRCLNPVFEPAMESSALLGKTSGQPEQLPVPSAWQITKTMYYTEGIGSLYFGVGICSLRAFIVNSVQWLIYESTMTALKST